jgi:hypothetical protein
MNTFTHIESLKHSFSVAKLDAFRKPQSDDLDTISQYIWNISICESFYPLLHNLEVSFRNGMNLAISNQLKNNDWILNQTAFLGTKSQNEINKAVGELTKNRKTITANRIVAEMTFGFWTQLLSNQYQTVFWNKRTFYNDVFQKLPRKLHNRQFLADRFHNIRKFRNRIFHHERILHKNLPKMHDEILDTIGLINPTLQKTTLLLDRFSVVYSNDYFDKIKSKLKLIIHENP